MSSRQNRAPRRAGIRGPQSALTDFLASQNISARQIRADADARRQATEAAAAAAQPDDNNVPPSAVELDGAECVDDEDEDEDEDEIAPPIRATRKAEDLKRKRETEAIQKIKKSKAFKRRKKDADDESDSDDLANAIFKGKLKPLPGQMENCEICEKRFTVTPYSRAGPNGGLVCAKCGKDLAKDDGAVNNKKKKKTAGQGASRRKVQSRILDGTYSVGAKSMMTLCIEKLVKHIDLASELGDLPTSLIDRIARHLAKRRLLTAQSLDLFLEPQHEVVKVYDGARLSSDDYIRIFQRVTNLKFIKFRNAIQFKDIVMQYLINRNTNLEGISLHGSNLLSEKAWEKYLSAKGEHLKSLQIYYTDLHVGDNLLLLLPSVCPSLERLKIAHNQAVTDKGVEHLAKFETLQHLSLELRTFTTTEPYVEVISGIGNNLRTLSLKAVPDLDDRVLDAIHANCRSLTKLRITESEVMTDPGFARLFKGWANKPLHFIDFRNCRHIDSTNPRENSHQVGLCSDGFRALMEHSGSKLRELNVHACRHISKEAFEDVFAAEKEYPELVKLEVSFCEEITDFIVGSIFRSCPNLRELNVFGCMKVKDVRVPRNKILVGVCTAKGMVIEGTED
ncbi:RNI-like protein [Truncatella angustata]|uniref:RNI-like protein n=1 Tax=Truncatella angustata TaxID=152316 RepID=A0A9P8UUI3_9PEZI|nr:RNI-like protein [Truncatella angustata]KAH6658312.1 RNI-like protein [Truncatella angustata]